MDATAKPPGEPHITPATDLERAEAARRWPALESMPQPCSLLVARMAPGAAIDAALVIDEYPVPFRKPGRLVRLFSNSADREAAPERDHALVRAAESRIRAAGLSALYARDSVPVDSEDQRWWRALGFSPNPKLRHYDVALHAYLDLLTPMYDALTVRGRVPIEARVVPLSEAPLGEVIQLQIEHIGGDAGHVETRLRGGGYFPFDATLSHVAMHDGRVCGMLLAQVDRYRRLTVESKVVAPPHRGRWVNVALMQEAAQAAVRQGFGRVQFLANERQQDTHRLARKAGGAMQLRDVMVRMVTLQ